MYRVVGFMALCVGAVPARGQMVNYVRDIKPILTTHCLHCHGADENSREADLRLDTFDGATMNRDGVRAIVPGKPDASEMIKRITSEDADLRMPPGKHGAALAAKDIARLKSWIASGAEYTPHWAFISPKRPPTPKTKHSLWIKNPIDAFIAARLEKEGLAPSPEAERAILIRRLSLDLIGLPPTHEEVQAFVADQSADAYERLVDRLLAHPGYGERWARVWLDLARYADSAGYGSDPLRTIWRYRDWTIDALNRNLPYDQFTIKQLAGDLLANPTEDDLLATAFHRNTMTNTEGGTDDEEFRVAAVKDRVDVTMQVWMGLTAGCAKCHSHKYDPISQEEYYQLFAIFNQTQDNDQPSESPTIASPLPEMKREIARIDAEIAKLRKKIDEPRAELAGPQSEWESTVTPTKPWQPIHPTEVATADGSSLAIEEDGSVEVLGVPKGPTKYTVNFEVGGESASAIRLDSMPIVNSSIGGAGRGADGNFVITNINVESAASRAADKTPVGRFVRIELPGLRRILHIAELKVFSGNENIARKGKARQSSTGYGGDASRAIDGETNGEFYVKNSVTHTNEENNPWWEVDLGKDQQIDRIELWNRTDSSLWTRLNGYRVVILDSQRKELWSTKPPRVPQKNISFAPNGWSTVNISSAYADFEQVGFLAAYAIDRKPKTGWAVGPKVKEPHALTLVFSKPVEAKRFVRITIDCAFEPEKYSLGRFKLSLGSDQKLIERGKLPAAVIAALVKSKEARSDADRKTLADYYRVNVAGKPILEEIGKLEKRRPKPPTVPIMKELSADKRRKTYILEKGNFLQPAKEVSAAFPSAFHQAPTSEPTNRRALANWLVSSDNPLTARVAVNRYWSRLFGSGIVETEEDFGTQGELPTHPELLDWLATEYMRIGWDTKEIIKKMVMSATYRQSSKTSPEHLEKDPANRLLARYPRQRLEAEMVRDQALALAGLLTDKIGGPSVFPPQPAGLWQAAFNGERTWATSKGNDRYRRGLYVFWRRTVPYPSMATFDAPSRESCTLRRKNTNTPLQAFVTLNDPCYVEAAQALARRIISQEGTDRKARARFGLELCLCRAPTEAQIDAIVGLVEKAKQDFAVDPKRATTFAAEPLGPLPQGADPAEFAAWTLASNVLLNLDGVLTKG